jgi:2-dehydropantoate 2-reductase
MRFHVAGLGSIGTLVAFHLRRVLPPQHTITLFTRHKRDARNLQSRSGAVSVEDGGVVMSRGGFSYEYTTPSRWYWPKDDLRVRRRRPNFEEQLRASRSLLPMRKRPPLQCLIVATKAHAALSVVRQLRHRIDSRTTLVLFQNGMGVYERIVQEVFPKRDQRPQIILTSNTHGAWAKDKTLVVHAGKGSLEFGVVPDPRRRRDFERAFNESTARPDERRGSLTDVANPPEDRAAAQFLPLRNTLSALMAMELNTRWRPIADLEIAMRRKLVVNSVINPLTAIMGCRNRDVFKRSEARRILRQVCAEAEAVFAAQLRVEGKEWEEEQNRLEATRDLENVDGASASGNQASSARANSETPSSGSQVAAVVGNSSDQAQDSVLAIDSAPGTSDRLESVEDVDHSQDGHAEILLSKALSDGPRLPVALRRDALIAECICVAHRTGDNFSSMLSDVRKGRPTEIDFMNGYITELGRRYGVPTPTTSKLLSLVKTRSAVPFDQSRWLPVRV